MKKIISILASGLVAMSLVGGAAAAAPKQQKVEGTILFPARHPDGCYTGLQRHLTSLMGEASNGIVGWTIRVDKATWNKPFKLDVTGAPVGTADLDMTYYFGEFATQEEFIANPAPVAPASTAFETHGQPGEEGKVPKGAINALVCIFVDETVPAAAANVGFSYVAGKGVK